MSTEALPLTEAGKTLLREHSSQSPHMARHIIAVEQEAAERARPVPPEGLRVVAPFTDEHDRAEDHVSDMLAAYLNDRTEAERAANDVMARLHLSGYDFVKRRPLAASSTPQVRTGTVDGLPGRWFVTPHRPAPEGAAASPAPLDVERLMKAAAIVNDRISNRRYMTVEDWQAIAREYEAQP